MRIRKIKINSKKENGLKQDKSSQTIQKKENIIIKTNYKSPELRKDYLTGKEIVYYDFFDEIIQDKVDNKISQKTSKLPKLKKGCPICYSKKSEMDKDSLIYKDNRQNWTLRVIPCPNDILKIHKEEKNNFKKDNHYFSPYPFKGTSELIFNINHHNDWSSLNKLEIAELFDSFQQRYLDLMKDRDIKYISLEKNNINLKNRLIQHEHCQLFAYSFIPQNIIEKVNYIRSVFYKDRVCPICLEIEKILEDKNNLIAEEDNFIAVAPYASSNMLEIRIYPKEHLPYFERIKNDEKINIGKLLKKVFSLIENKLGILEYTMNIFTSPCNGIDYNFNHWYISICPSVKLIKDENYSLGLNSPINFTFPEKWAKFLTKKIKKK